MGRYRSKDHIFEVKEKTELCKAEYLSLFCIGFQPDEFRHIGCELGLVLDALCNVFFLGAFSSMGNKKFLENGYLI